MMIVDPETGAILDANNAALEFYQYSKKEMLSLKISNINILPIEKIIPFYNKDYVYSLTYCQYPLN